jgi:hypothetical protein
MARLGITLVLGVLFIASVGFYFLPTIIAAVRRKTNFVAILLLNFILGWTLIGWVVALVWAVATEQIDHLRPGTEPQNIGQPRPR